MSDKLRDNISRVKEPSPLGKSIFVGLRAADVLAIYSPNPRMGHPSNREARRPCRAVLTHPQSANPHPTPTLLRTRQSPVPWQQREANPPHGLCSEQAMSISSGMAIPAFNTVFNTLNTLLSLWALTSPAPSVLESSTLLDTLSSSPWVAVGLGAYVVGLLVEAVSEFQRKAFKQDPRNNGKPYGDGLFSLATNINYGGYTVWRAGYALVCGGLGRGMTTFGFFFHDFAYRGVPVLEGYMTEKYGDAYREIKSRVRYSLIPGIY